MNALEALRENIREKFPSAQIDMSSPMRPDGVWWLDVVLNSHHVVVQWEVEGEFGVALLSDGVGYGMTAPDTSCTESDAALQEISRLLNS